MGVVGGLTELIHVNYLGQCLAHYKPSKAINFLVIIVLLARIVEAAVASLCRLWAKQGLVSQVGTDHGDWLLGEVEASPPPPMWLYPVTLVDKGQVHC